MTNRPYVITTSIVLLFAVICFSLSPTAAKRAKRLFSSLYTPLFKTQRIAQSTGEYLSNQTISREALLDENAELKRQNSILELKLDQTVPLSRENRDLREQLKMRPRPEWNPRFARIIGRDPSNWWRSILIDLGANDGVKIDMPVVAKTGLIGRVQEAYPNRSQIALLGDPDCRVSVTIEATKETGILKSTGETVYDPTLVKLTHLPGVTLARPGDKLYSSGLGEIFPRGIYVGKLLAIHSRPGSLTTTATVKLSTNTSQLNEVWVLMP